MTGEMKRMLTGKSFLAAWLIACLSLAAGASYPNLKKFWNAAPSSGF